MPSAPLTPAMCMADEDSLSSKLGRLVAATEILHTQDDRAFHDRVLEACRHLFPECFGGFELWDRLSGEHTGAIDIPYAPVDLAQRFQRMGEIIPTQHPSFPLIAAGVTSALRLSDLTTLRQLRRTEFYDIAFAPLGIRHQVAIPIQTQDQLGGVTFNKGGRQDFDKEDMRIISLFSRHVLIAYQNTQILAQAQARQQAARVQSTDHLELRRAGLTKRESEVLLWMAQGKRDREIAVILGNSYRTVTNHVRAILTKLRVENRTAAVSAMQRLISQH